jgi:transcriptional regulator with XRE-family HTH domain
VINLTLGETLKKLREEKNLLQSDVAKFLKVTQKTISNYEKNERRPDPETLKKLADYFNVSTDFLLNRDSFVYTPPSESQMDTLERFFDYFHSLSDDEQKKAAQRIFNHVLEGDNKKK